MALKIDSPSILQYTEFLNGSTAVPIVHIFARDENGELYVRSGQVVSGPHIQGTWTKLGLTPSGAQVASQPVGTTTYIDTAGVRQAHAFVVGQDNQLSTLSLNVDTDSWDWRKLPPPPAGHRFISPPTVVPFLFEQSTWRINALICAHRESDAQGVLLAYVFDGTQETWIDFPKPEAGPNDLDFVFQFGAALFEGVNLTEIYTVIAGTAAHQSFLLSWDGSASVSSKKVWTTLTQGQPPNNLFSNYMALTKVSIPLLDTQRLVASVIAGSAPPHLFACVSDDGTNWVWQDRGSDASGRSLGGKLGSFGYIRVISSPTGRFFVPLFVTSVLYGDGSVGMNFWDGQKSNWANLGLPPGGATGIPCGAGFYVGPDDQAVETVVILTQTVDGKLYVNQPGPFGRQWLPLEALPMLKTPKYNPQLKEFPTDGALRSIQTKLNQTDAKVEQLQKEIHVLRSRMKAS